MTDFLDELTLDHLSGEYLELAETIGLESFKKLVAAYGGSGRTYIPAYAMVVQEIRNQHIYEDYHEKGLDVYKIAKKYNLGEARVRKIINDYRKKAEQKT